ncbi:MAG: helix-turn-helix domain-containing protein [Candidatus Aenigmarchaeota archaeon]|nr:helix-turn-helix domain-containing protein [Candidatus Aenigmarchaeota archaeon]
MAKKLLVERKGGKYLSKGIKIIEDPTKLSPALNKTTLKILREIAKKPSYPKEIAKNLKLDRQVVYYYIHKLENSGLIKVVKEMRKKGAICKFYLPISDAFGFELTSKQEALSLKETSKVEEFFEEFIASGMFDGSIVVGSPLQHGPFLTAARDGHYAIQLAMFLGSFCELPKKYVVKLDTEVKAEHEERRNMILIGGPITNMISNEINDKLKIRFIWIETWKIFSELSKKEYVDEDLGIIAKIKNPWDETKRIILLSGLKFEGTKSCIIAIIQFFDSILKNYESGKDFFCLIRGLDRDGDGKVDDIGVVEKLIV